MYKPILLAVVLFVVSANAAPQSQLKVRETGRDHLKTRDFQMESVGVPEPKAVVDAGQQKIANQLASLRRNFKPTKSAGLSRETTHEDQESTSQDEHTSKTKNGNKRVSAKNRDKTKRISEKENFATGESESKKTRNMSHNKKSYTNYNRQYDQLKTKNERDFDEDESSNQKFVAKKSNAINKLRRNHAKQSNGETTNESENYDNGESEEYTKSS